MSGAQKNAENEAKARAAGTWVNPHNPLARFAAKKPAEPAELAQCYTADIMNGKYVCPKCGNVEGGTLRIITHNFNCPNYKKEYCQRNQFGGRRRTTRKSRRKVKKTRRRHR
jgi:hypothetical protein